MIYYPDSEGNDELRCFDKETQAMEQIWNATFSNIRYLTKKYKVLWKSSTAYIIAE